MTPSLYSFQSKTSKERLGTWLDLQLPQLSFIYCVETSWPASVSVFILVSLLNSSVEPSYARVQLSAASPTVISGK